jgi:hypothetical protein
MNARFALLIALSICPLAQAQTIQFLHGQKVLVDEKGNVIPFPTIVPVLPAAPLVGGADSCVTPDVIMGTGSIAFDTTTATTGTQGQNEVLCNNAAQIGINRDVWYTWTSGFSGLAIISFCTTASFDTKVAVYAGTTCPSTSAIACNDDSCGLQSRLTFNATSGSSYVIQVGQYGTGTPTPGTFSLTQAPPPPVNDSCTSPIAVVGAGPFAFDSTWATTGAQGQAESLCTVGTSTAVVADSWYSWTATFTGYARVATCGGATSDTKIAVYAGTSCPIAGSALACNDDLCGTQSQADFSVTQGSAYLIQIGSPNIASAIPGSGTFTVGNIPPPPSNDDCSTPLPVAGPGTYAFDNTNATTGVQYTASCGTIYKDTWWTYTPGSTGTATLTTCGYMTSTTGSSFDTKVAIYDGTGCPSVTSIACNDDSCSVQTFATTLSWPTTCGNVYTIRLGAFGATYNCSGSFNITEVGGSQCGPTGMPFCFGDGTGTACPCGNNGAPGNGCASSINVNGANLTTSGASSLANDTLVLLGSGMPNSSCLYFQGTTQISAAFGDGLRCAGGSVVRLSTKTNVGGVSQYPSAGNPPVSVKGAVTSPGTRTYQTWYRNAAAFCTPSTFNLTNGILITWQ